LRSPDDEEPSEVRIGKNYGLSKGDITDAEPDQFGRQHFRYSMFEVFKLPDK